MKAQDLPFEQIVEGSKQFIVPVFQRDYSWTQKHCEQLWDDILRVGEQSRDAKHFLGSIVYVQAQEVSTNLQQWLVIDGQQRLTTLTLLLVALRDRIEASRSGGDGLPTAEEIQDRFLINRHGKGDLRWKLLLRRNDDLALRAIVSRDDPPHDAAESVIENHQFFNERLDGEDLRRVWQGIRRLVLVDVSLKHGHDDPQMIFESLNSTGLELTQADLIRNYILMRVAEPEQTRLYDAYWSRIEDLFRGGGRTFDAFARDYMALRTRMSHQVRADEVYHEFRKFFGPLEQQMGIESALEEMLRFARHHAAFSLGRGTSEPLAPALRRLNSLADPVAIFVMRLFDCRDRLQTLSDNEFLNALGLIESFIVRRAVCGMQSRAYWQTFANLAYALDESMPLRSLEVGLSRLHSSYRFPSDDEFERELQNRDLYSMRTCHYILDRLENWDTKEPTNTASYSVEHVMPQNEKLSKDWQRMLGDDWQRVQSTWLHRLGNLTLTGYNSNYSDKAFTDKKSMPGGFSDSAVKLNKDVSGAAEWNEAVMQERGRRLAKRATKVWPALSVSPEAIQAAERAELIERSKRRRVEQVPMSEFARQLFDKLRPLVRELSGQVVELAESKSISYHAANFFLEVLPRERRLVLLLDLTFAECVETDDQTRDATETQFLANAVNTGGVYYRLSGEDQIPFVMKLVRQAHDLSIA